MSFNPYIRHPVVPRRWNLDQPSTLLDKSNITPNGLLDALEAHGRIRRKSGTPTAGRGDFVILDRRWHRVEGFVKHRRGPRMQVRDLLEPSVVHVVAWSDVTHFARAADVRYPQSKNP